MAEQIRELAQALKEETERHQLQELGQIEVAEKAASDIRSHNYYYKKRAAQIDSIVSKLSGGNPMPDESLGGDLRSLVMAYKEENEALRMQTQTA